MAAARLACAGLLLSLPLAAACGQTYPASGLVLAVDRQASVVTISHEEIPGFMEAMAMPFTARRSSDLDGIVPGDRVAFRLVVRRGRSTIDRVEILSAAPADYGLLASPAAPALVAIGEPVPDFELIDQRGRPLALSALRGWVVALNFIYTRCPLPDYCPRMVTSFTGLRDRFRDRLDRDLVLLTVSFDPRHDTSERLAIYAGAFGAGTPGWHFLTGPVAEIERVCGLFGLEFWPDEGLLTHNLRTTVIDRDGRLAATVEGKEHSDRQLGDLIGQVLDR